jgi:hypothetical protein
VNGDEFELKPGSPLFFLSYAHVNPNRGEVARFFEDLSIDVNELIGGSAGVDPGFIDTVMGGGERWSPELLRATGTCQVFVPLISTSLVNSTWCGMEWHAFARRPRFRRADRRPDNATGIVPVRWSPTELDDLPPVVQKIQWFSPGRPPDPQLPARYEQEGVYGLLRLGMNDEYRAVVWRLAQHVVAIFRTHWVTSLIPSSPDDLRNVFLDGEVT